eukprot:CAMPEP_0205821874 /NCGR_PEP_ID=MMETSP0206-20130828/9833_1 /ASSEMBLY_ACC=CAM_ASM_000279 /TAXON_ID=36767 /ORGANISM="Euplotes focardii, Strain TN1" /LENGTH=371 /DNA_ID=CAMNT_0053117689 /DNA_START=158 /DNA_END=1273 /DNA_ORIENTATION=+
MTGLPAGYGFVEFETGEEAKRIKEMLNGTPIPGLNKTFRLNWAVQSGGAAKVLPQSVPNIPMSGSGDFSVYVGDLDPNVTDSILLEAFSSRYKSIISANVIVDPITKRSKKYGFVRFSNQEESQGSIMEMNGQYILSRPIKLNVGFKKSNMQQPQQPQMQSYGQGGGNYQGYGQAPAPSYPPAYSGYSDPYGGKPSYGYGGYGGYSQPDPYGAPPSQSYYGSYPSYPPPATGGGYGGSSSAAPSYPPPSTGGGYDYNQSSSYPSYGGTNNYGDSSNQSYGAPSSAQPAPGPYQYSSYYGNNSGYDYGIESVQAPPPGEIEAPAPVQATKEVDYDLGEVELKPLYNEDTTVSANGEYFQTLLESNGTIDITL